MLETWEVQMYRINKLFAFGLFCLLALSASANAQCFVTVATCACDRDLGGPGSYTVCPDGSHCAHDIVTCEPGTKCGSFASGKDDCDYDMAGLCEVHMGICYSGGICGQALG